MTEFRLSDVLPASPATRRRILGLVLAAMVVVLYAWLVAGRGVFDAFGRVEGQSIGLLLLLTFVAIALWSLSLRLVLATAGAEPPLWRAMALFLASVFLNGVTPFGQAGGDPPSGLLLARSEAVPFERGLAAITSVNVLNRLAVVALGAVSAAWLAVRVALPAELWMPVAVAVVLVLSLGFVAVVAWRHRERLLGIVAGATTTIVAGIGRRVSSVPTPSHDAVRQRVFGFVAVFERLEARPRRLLAMLALGIVGQAVVGGVLWFALVAVGASTPLAVALVVITAAKLSGLVPLPGGAVAAEALLTGLLVAATGLPVPVATAAALLYRATAFWVPTLTGGVVTVWLLAITTDT